MNKAIILAAGYSVRLRPLTDNKPKTLLDIGRITIFDTIIKALMRYNINDIVLVTGYAYNVLEEYIAQKYNDSSIRFSFIRNPRLDYGNIYSFYIAKEYMDNDFILINSDLVFHPKILEYVLEYNNISVLAIDDYKELGKEEMKVKADNNIIKDISKDIPLEEADGEYIGIMRLRSEDAKIVIKSIEELFKDGKYNLYYEDAIRAITNKYDIFYKCSTRGLPSIEIDTQYDLEEAHSIINKIDDYNDK